MSASRLGDALDRIDRFNDADPNRSDGGDGVELVYGRRMSARLASFRPDASEALQIAARAQHIGRWRIARADYPEGRAGYKRWRSDLARLHAETAGDIARDAGYDDATVNRVQAIVGKQNRLGDDEVQALEDVACLVFLEHYFADFARKHEPDKLARIARKTWNKMSERGQAAARELTHPEPLAQILARALGS